MFDSTVGGASDPVASGTAKARRRDSEDVAQPKKVPHNMAIKNSVFGKMRPQKKLKYGTLPKGLSRI
jgi:hypothetical protein